MKKMKNLNGSNVGSEIKDLLRLLLMSVYRSMPSKTDKRRETKAVEKRAAFGNMETLLSGDIKCALSEVTVPRRRGIRNMTTHASYLFP